MSAIPVQVDVQNNFSQAADTIWLTHQFSSNPIEYRLWHNVASGAVSDPPQTVNGNTDSGHDEWCILVILADGTAYAQLSAKTCTIESADLNTVQTHQVSKNGWTIALASGGCSTGLDPLAA